jgi:hypothetical protein
VEDYIYREVLKLKRESIVGADQFVNRLICLKFDTKNLRGISKQYNTLDGIIFHFLDKFVQFNFLVDSQIHN